MEQTGSLITLGFFERQQILQSWRPKLPVEFRQCGHSLDQIAVDAGSDSKGKEVNEKMAFNKNKQLKKGYYVFERRKKKCFIGEYQTLSVYLNKEEVLVICKEDIIAIKEIKITDLTRSVEY